MVGMRVLKNRKKYYYILWSYWFRVHYDEAIVGTHHFRVSYLCMRYYKDLIDML